MSLAVFALKPVYLSLCARACPSGRTLSVMPFHTIAMKGLELFHYAKDKYQDELSREDVNIGSGVTVQYLMLNGVQMGLAKGRYTLGVHFTMPGLLYEARGACAPVVGRRKKGFLVFGARDFADRLVDPFFVRVHADGNAQLIVGEDGMEQVEALFRMLLVLAIGW